MGAGSTGFVVPIGSQHQFCDLGIEKSVDESVVAMANTGCADLKSGAGDMQRRMMGSESRATKVPMICASFQQISLGFREQFHKIVS